MSAARVPVDILALPLKDGTLFIGQADRIAAVVGAARAGAGPSVARLPEILASHPDSWRLRNTAVAWGLESFGRLPRQERDLREQISMVVESGRLSARFLPLFIDDPRAPSRAGPLRVYQLDGGPPAAAPPPQRSASASPPPRPTIDRSPLPPPPKDFDDEDAQIAVLRAAAKDGTPFCEQCARATRGAA